MVLIVTCLSRDLLRDALVDLAAVISVAAWPLLLCPVFYEQLRLYFENPTYHSSGIDSTHKKYIFGTIYLATKSTSTDFEAQLQMEHIFPIWKIPLQFTYISKTALEERYYRVVLRRQKSHP